MEKEKERFELFEGGKNLILDNEQSPQLLDSYLACVRLNEFNSQLKELKLKYDGFKEFSEEEISQKVNTIVGLEKINEKLEGELDWERRNKICIVKQFNDPKAYVSLEDYKKLERSYEEKATEMIDLERLKDQEIEELKSALRQNIGDLKSNDFIKLCLKSGFVVEAKTSVPSLEHQVKDTIYVLDFDRQVRSGEVVDIQITDFSQGNPNIEYEVFMGSWEDSDWYSSSRCFKTLEEAEKAKEAKDE